MATSIDEEQNNVEKIPMTEENCESGHSPSHDDDIIPQKVMPTPREIFFHFTQHTTLHGVRLILMDHVGIVRRILWFLLFLTCTALMGVQIVDRILHYYSYPVNINYNINFDKMLAFPTLTLCNENTFRASAASRRGWYPLVGGLYSSKVQVDEDTLEAYNASLLTIEELHMGTAHKKEDFIVACEWQNEVCGPENFTEVLTDLGVCYSFNNRGAPLYTSTTGPGSGLKLTLNVEQYEYMPGPNRAAGVKMLLHDHKEYPRVNELGLAVGTGTHAFVGIQLFKIKNLPKPYGECQSESSRFYDQYSPDACQLACMTVYLDELCGCRHIYMPHDEGNPPVCNLDQYLTCLRGAIASAKEYVRDTCDCPAPCDFLLYDPIISYASTSAYATDRLLAASSSGSLRKKYLQARETTSRMDRAKFQHFTQLTNLLRASFRNLQDAFNRGIQNSLQYQKTTLASIHGSMKDAWSKKKYLLEWQKYHVEKNFVKAKEEMEERTLFYLALGYPEFSYQVESRIKQIDRVSWNATISDNVRTALYFELLNMLNGRIDLAEKARIDYTKLYDAYRNGEPIFKNKFQEESIDDNEYITPRSLLKNSLSRTLFQEEPVDSIENITPTPLLNYSASSSVFQEELIDDNVTITPSPLLNYSLSSNVYQEELTDDNEYITLGPQLNYSVAPSGITANNSINLVEDIENLKYLLLEYVSLANKTYFENISIPEEIDQHGTTFLNWGQKFYQSKSKFYVESVNYPLEVVQQKLDDFEQRWKDFEQILQFMAEKIEFLIVSLSKHQKDILSILDQNIAKAEMYISFNNVTKMQVAEVFTSEPIRKGIAELVNFFSEIRSRGQDVYDSWTALNQSTNAIWTMILKDEAMQDYYRYKNMTELLNTFDQVSSQVGRNYTRFRDAGNFQLVLGKLDGSFLRNLNDMTAEIKHFVDGSGFDTNFIKNNFLRLDVFYKEKGFEHIAQQAAYDVFALLCDIGGTMALFLGASILTLCELLDLGLHHAIYRLTHNNKFLRDTKQAHDGFD